MKIDEEARKAASEIEQREREAKGAAIVEWEQAIGKALITEPEECMRLLLLNALVQDSSDVPLTTWFGLPRGIFTMHLGLPDEVLKTHYRGAAIQSGKLSVSSLDAHLAQQIPNPSLTFGHMVAARLSIPRSGEGLAVAIALSRRLGVAVPALLLPEQQSDLEDAVNAVEGGGQ